MAPPERSRIDVAGWIARLTTSPAASAAVVLGLSLVAAGLLPEVEIETDVSRLLPEQNPVTRLHRVLDARTGASRSLVIDLEPGEDRDVGAVVERLRASPHLERVDATREALLDALAPIARAPLWYLPEATVEAIRGRLGGPGLERALEATRERLAEDPFGGRELALADPLGLRELYAEGARALADGRFRTDRAHLELAGSGRVILRVVGRASPFDTPATEALLADLDARLAGLDARLVGSYARVAGDAERITRDLVVSASASVVLVGLFLAWALRRLADAAAVLAPVGLALFWTMPIGGALLGALTPLTMSAAAILMGLGVDFSIHYLVAYRAARRHADHASAVQATLRAVGRPLVTALFTTALAFLSFVLAEFDGLRVFGWLLALGLLFAFLACLFVCPWVLRIAAPEAARSPRRSPVVRALERLRSSRAGPGLAVALPILGLAGFATAAGLGVPFSTDSRHLRPYDDPAWAAERALEAQLGQGLSPFGLVFPAGTTNASVQAGFRALGDEIARTDRPDLSAIPAGRGAHLEPTRAAAAELVPRALDGLERIGLTPAPFRPGLEASRERLLRRPRAVTATLAGPVEPVLGAPSVVVSGFLSEGLHAVDDWPELRARIDAAFAEPPRVSHVYALLYEMQSVLGRDLRRAGLVTAVVALLLLAALCGGPRAGAVAAIPAFSTLGVTLGVMALFDLPLNMSNCVAVPFLLGIGVDAGIHLVAELARGGPLEAGTASVAVWRTSATTALGFGSLALATVPGIASLGIIMMVGVSTAFATSLLVLPAAWSRLGPRGPAR